MEINKSFWSGKNVIVTGHTGFKGSWLTLWLLQMGAKVTGIAKHPDTQPNLFESIADTDGLDSFFLDIREQGAVDEVFRKVKPELVFHMAAQSIVSESYRNPVYTYETNVLGTVYILEAARKCGSLRALVNITSDKCYENKEWVWGYREMDELGGSDPYSNSKACAELVTRSYIKSFFGRDERPIGVATVRAGNVIGGGDWSRDRLIPDLVRSVTENRPLVLRSPGSVRPWQHVLEPLHGYLLLAENLYQSGDQYGGAWNFGPEQGSAKEVAWVVEEFSRCWGNQVRKERIEGDSFRETGYLYLDSSKANTLLGWKPKLDLTKAIAMTAEWYRAFYANQDVVPFTIDQIRRFSEA